MTSFSLPATQYAAIQTLIDTLRKRGGVDIVIALSHSGTDPTGTSGEDVELARHVTGIDVIASGHTHTPLASARTVVNGTWSTHIINAGAFGTNVSRIDLSYRRPTKTATLSSSSNVAMTDASLNAIQPDLLRDANVAAVVLNADRQLNVGLAGFFADFCGLRPGRSRQGHLSRGRHDDPGHGVERKPSASCAERHGRFRRRCISRRPIADVRHTGRGVRYGPGTGRGGNREEKH